MATHTFEDVLARSGTVAFPVRGVSMRPLIKAGRDAVLVSAKDGRLERFDVGLFRRDNGEYVLHRVMSVQDGEYLFNGDSQTFTERVREDQVLGSMEGLTRKGRPVDLEGLPYRTYVALWCGLFPVRRLGLKVLHKLGVWVPGRRGLVKAADAARAAGEELVARVRSAAGAPDAGEPDAGTTDAGSRGVGPDDEAAAAAGKADVSQEVVDLLYLCGRALAGKPADPARVAKMRLDRVHALADNQSLAALAWHALEPLVVRGMAKGPLLDAWRNQRDQAIRRQMLFAAERAQILAWMREHGVWYALLKGAVLADWYPRPGMREFSDNDILYDGSRREDVARFFKGRGYTRNGGGHTTLLDDAYTKEPVFMFELQRQLFNGYYSPDVARFFDGLPSRLVRTGDSAHDLRLSWEDFYLYLIAHAHKHHMSGGTGVRILADLWVFHGHEGIELDEEYVERSLAEMGIGEFAASLERLVERVFEPDFTAEGLAAEDAEQLRALTSYGMYGTVDHKAELMLERSEEQGEGTGSYVLGRIIPDDIWWEANFPFAKDHVWARPPLLVYRYARAAFEPKRRQRVAAEVKALVRRIRGE